MNHHVNHPVTQKEQNAALLPVAKIGAVVAIVLAVAVVSVLVTPDPTDDVEAILHPGKAIQVQALALVSAPTVTLIAPATRRLQMDATPNVTPSLLQLLCSCRC